MITSSLEKKLCKLNKLNKENNVNKICNSYYLYATTTTATTIYLYSHTYKILITVDIIKLVAERVLPAQNNHRG